VSSEDLIKRTNLSDIVIQRIKVAIGKGELKPGDRIPSHNELCERWGISRTTIREALNKLESEGILTKYQGRGTYINEITPSRILSATELSSLLDRSGVIQLLEARELVEPSIVELSAKRRTDRELESLGQLLEELEQASQQNDHTHYSEADHQFHLLTTRMSKNPFLEVMMRNISEALVIQQIGVFSLKKDEQIRISAESQKYHKRIFAAIKEGNPEKAKRSMLLHLKSIERFMKRNL
jgi:GntR family transcriptional repressor for pyruvate dehydrogenase complex